MKRLVIINILIILLICIANYVSADSQKNINSKIKFLETADNVETTILENVEKSKNIIINNNEIGLEYKETKNNLNVYVNNNDENYIFKNEKLVGFFKPVEINKNSRMSNTEIDVEKAKEIAQEFIEKNIESFNKYNMVSANYIETYNQYNIRFMRKVKGFDTRDVVEINVDKNAEIASFSAVNQGEFEKYEDVEIDIKTINNLCFKIIQNKYGKKINKTEIKQQYLKLLDGKLVLQTDIIIYLKDNIVNQYSSNYEFESIIYELN